MDALIVLWICRIAAFWIENWTEAEARIVEEAKTFGKLKFYLIDKY